VNALRILIVVLVALLAVSFVGDLAEACSGSQTGLYRDPNCEPNRPCPYHVCVLGMDPLQLGP
jgi:hypothetical protein